MSDFIRKLLKGKSVEWKPLGEVFDILVGGDLPKNALSKVKTEQYNIPILSNGIGSNSLYGWTDTAKIHQPSLTISARGTIGWTSFRNNPFFPIVRLLVLTPKIELHLKYIYYFMKTIENNYKTPVSGIPQLTKPMIKNIQIPIPPLSVQAEIVRVLDAFTALTAELTAELTMRQKQYNHYRDTLLTFQDGQAEWKTLGEVTLSTHNVKWKDNNQIYRYIDLTSVSRENKAIVETVEISASNAPSRAQKLIEKNDILFATTRPTLQRYTLISDKFSGEIASTGYCVLRANTKKLLPQWVYYNISSTRFNDYVEQNQSGSAYPAISDIKVKEFKIPIPPLAEQERIVSILDKFDILTNSITEGLPREIALRQQQYEYYREQLLNFPK